MPQKIDVKMVDELAHLARLEFNDASKQEIINDMNRMLAFVDKLSELKTDDVEPLIYMTNETNVMREDDAIQSITQDEALKNAPRKDSDYFKVPKVIDQN
jgi:aspartyl-tRNA(Asn)/glutamyl-tRNA(Gln) amidotransferase subunit C